MEKLKKLPTKSVKEIISIFDTTFGLFIILYVLVIFVAFFQGLVSIHAQILVGTFLILNLVISQFSIRLENPLKIEIFRYFVALIFFCPIILDSIFTPFGENFWYGYLVMGVAGSITFYQLTSKPYIGFLASLLAVISYILANFLLLNDTNWYQTFIHAITILMFAILFVRILTLINKSFSSEIEKSERLEDALSELQKTQELAIFQSKMSSLGEMAGGIAHEINNPLAIISSTVLYLEKKQKKQGSITQEDLQEGFSEIKKTVERVQKIVLGMRNISRDSSESEFTAVPANQVLEDVLNVSSQKFKTRGIEIQIDNKIQSGTMVQVDIVQLSQVFINLLNNAYDVLIELDSSEKKWIQIILEEDHKNTIFRVANSGPLIPHDIQLRIFEPFFTTKGIGKGTGLGLGISKRIMEKHNGDITLDNSKGYTCFVLTIPKKER